MKTSPGCAPLSPFLVFVFISLFLAPGILAAQSAANSGQIVGRVEDPSSASIAGVEVTLRNKDTNLTRRTSTDNEGRYAASNLPLGPYEISAKADLFEMSSAEAFLTAGSSVSVNFRLEIAGKAESVQVIATAETPGVEATRTAPKSILTDLQIHELPSNGRRIQNLVTQMPATLIEPECSGFSVSGQKGIYANVSVDGGDYNGTWTCGVRGRSSSSPTLGFESLREVQIVRNSFSSEFGRTTGGLIQMSTRSGTNNFHASAYELARDGSMAASDALGRYPIARVHQFGGSLGGPISKDRTFFFVAPEFQYGSKPVTVIYGMTAAQRASAAGQSLLAAAPEETFKAISNWQSVITRIDHQISQNNSFFGRFDFVRVNAENSPGANALQTSLGLASTTTAARSNLLLQPETDYTVFVQLNSAFSQSHLNELRVQFSHDFRPRVYQGTGPQITVTNIATYGPPSSGSWGNVGFASSDNRYQLVDAFSIISGAHTTKFGVDYQRLSGYADYNQTFNGAYTFNTLADLLARTPSSYQQFTGSGMIRPVIHELGLFVQDEWRLRPGLTVSPGLRYEAQFNPNYLPATAPQYRFPLATTIPNDVKMFAPRLGLAWDIANDGKTIVRAGGGFYYAPTYMSLFAQSMLFNGGNPDLAFSIRLTGANAIQNAFQAVGANLASAPLSNLPVFDPAAAYKNFGSFTNIAPSYFDPKFRNPRALQWQGGVERQVSRSITVSEGFTYIATDFVARERDTNLGPSVVDSTGRNIYSNPRPYGPVFGATSVTEAGGRSLYRGFTTTVNVRRPRYVVDIYYTRSWNYSYDDVERGFTGFAYADANNLESEYNFSNIDEPHQFIGNMNYFLRLGFEISSSLKFTSGRPINALTGKDDNLDGNSKDRPIVNGVMFKRNAFRNNGFKDTSLRIQKNFTMPKEKGKISLSAEAFNIFNFKNVWMASTQTYGPTNPNFLRTKDANGSYVSTDSVANDSRTFQLGLRYQF